MGLIFFENEVGAAVLVNVLRYRTTINEFLWSVLEDMDVDDVYFQQDGAGVTWHTSGETIGLLREKFLGRVISRNGDYNWPPHSGLESRIPGQNLKIQSSRLSLIFSKSRTDGVREFHSRRAGV